MRWPAVIAAGAVTVAVVASTILFLPPVIAGALVGTPRAATHRIHRAAGSSSTGAAGSSSAASSSVGADPISLTAVPSGETTLTYCAEDGVKETLDVYEPSPLPAKAVPAVVYVHGGGWVQGDSAITAGSLVGQVAAAVEAKGWVFVSIDYRLAPQYKWPAQIDDASCAVRFLRAASASLHIDPKAIGALGDSAGGQIVSLLGLDDASAGFDSGPYASQSSVVDAVADLYGPADLTTADWVDDPLIELYAPQAFGTKLGPETAGSSAAASLTAASPDTYVGPGAPPFLIIQGAEDGVVPPDQSTGLAQRLRAAGDPATLIMVKNAGHGLITVPSGPVTPSITTLAGLTASFFFSHLHTTAR